MSGFWTRVHTLAALEIINIERKHDFGLSDDVDQLMGAFGVFQREFELVDCTA